MPSRVRGRSHPKCFEAQEYCSDCLEFQKAWSSKASEVATLKGLALRLGERAADYFIAGRDEVAIEVRDIMRDVQARRNEESVKLDRDFISVAHPSLHREGE